MTKPKEDEKLDKYLNFSRDLKKLWNMKMTVIPIVVRALGTVPKNMAKKFHELEIRERNHTIQTTAQPKSDRILSEVLET